MHMQSSNPRTRRSFLSAAVGGAGGLALVPWSPAFGAQPPGVTDLIIFLPGIMGSVLQQNHKDVWAVSPESIGGTLATLGQNLQGLALKDDPQDVEDLGDGVVATGLFPDVHLIPGLWKIDGYSGVRAALGQALKLDDARNYIEFAYDWRRDNRVAARKLARLVPAWLDQWKKISGHDSAKVVFIAHSMGGLVARYYLECLEGWRHARKLISIGTPYRGSLNALDFLSNGYTKKFAGFNVVDLSALVRSFTSVYQLMPVYPCVDPDDGGDWRSPWEMNDLPHIAPAKAKAARAFHKEMEDALRANAGSKEYQSYPVQAIVGTDQPTKQSARVDEGRLVFSNELKEQDDGGDGTVPSPSAIPFGAKKEDNEEFFDKSFGVSGIHGSLQNLPQVIHQISHLLSHPDFSRFGLRGEPPISLHVDDAYQAGEPVKISCDTRSLREASTLKVEDVATDKRFFNRELAPESDQPITVENLPVGTYRATLQIQNTTRSISDVFLVSR